MTSSQTVAVASGDTTAQTWKDGKRWLWLASPLLPVAMTACLLMGWLSGDGLFFWAFPVIFYGLIPLLDLLIGEDPVNAPESAIQGLIDDRYYRYIVYAYIPAQYIGTIGGAWLFTQGHLQWWELLGLIISVGMISGVGINTAHELGHKTGKLERWLAKLTLAPVAYGHFFIEHNKGHHKNVATAHDPASSKMGETFWAFLPRTMIGSLRSAWNLEAERLRKLGKSPLSWENENIQAWAMTVVLFAALAVWLGPWALLFLLPQAFYGAMLLEVVNYLEHYGLLRKTDASGRPERCQPRHSWNSNHIVTNLVLYQLQRHSDHHANPTRRYQALRHFEDSPQLPSGYASMILIAYLPPLWFRMMDHRVVAHHRGDLTQANLYGPRREALLRRWMGADAVRARAAGAPPATIVAEMSATAQVDAQARYICPNCSYVYDPRRGCAEEGLAPGTPWKDVPRSWTCPQCAVRDAVDFVLI